MGIVYQAVQTSLSRPVAVKVILTGGLAGTEERVRFLMEGELLARLNHPHFVQVYEVGTIELPNRHVEPYLVMEYVEGGSLKARLAQGPLPLREAAQIIRTMARAMEIAHAQGIIHRDLKPANVLLARDGTLKITDFGLAKQVDVNRSLTPTGATLGTPHYMAPEQAGFGQTPVGPAADVYALGVLLYECLAGRTPFEGDTPVSILLHVRDTTPPPLSRLRRGVPRDLELICRKCLEKEPRRRYLRAADLADDLEAWLEGRPIRARPVGTAERAWRSGAPAPAPGRLALLPAAVASGGHRLLDLLWAGGGSA